MEDKKFYLRLGLFVVVSLILLFCVLFILGARSLFQPTFTIETYFDESIQGLDVGAPLKYRGVTLGQVTSIGLSPMLYEEDVPVDQRKGYIVVRATISGPRVRVWRNEMAAYVKRGLRVRTQLAGITGQQFLTLDFLDPAKDPALPFGWEPEYPYVPSAPSLASEIVSNVQNIVSKLDRADIEQLGQNLNALVVNVNKKLDELPVAQLSADADAVLKSARATIDRLDRALARAPLDETVRNLAEATGRLNRLLADPALAAAVDDAAAIAARLRKIAETGELDRIVKNLDRTMQRADAILADNQYDLRGVVRDLRVTAENLRTLSDVAKRYPPGLLVGGPPQKTPMTKEGK